MTTDSNPLEPPETVGEKDVDHLYEVPLDEFTGTRDALARELRQGGRRSEADWVKRLRKPSVAAWAVNQLIRSRKREAKALFAAADGLRRAQEELERGDADAARLRDAGEEERRAVSDLVEAAEGLQGGERLSPTALERIRETLHAAALDDETRRGVEAARLFRETSAVGFGLVAPSGGKRKERGGGKTGERSPGDRGRSGSDGTEREAKRRVARDELSRLEDMAKEERRSVSAARKAVREAKRERDQAQRRLDEAEQRASEAESRVQSAEREAAEAKRRLRKLRGR